jgi:hypothetical protein
VCSSPVLSHHRPYFGFVVSAYLIFGQNNMASCSTVVVTLQYAVGEKNNQNHNFKPIHRLQETFNAEINVPKILNALKYFLPTKTMTMTIYVYTKFNQSLNI